MRVGPGPISSARPHPPRIPPCTPPVIIQHRIAFPPAHEFAWEIVSNWQKCLFFQVRPLFPGEASCVCSCIGDPLKAESCVTDSIPPQVPARLGRRGRRGGAQAAPADQRRQEWNLVGRRCPVTTVWHCSGQIGQSTQTVVFTVVFQTRALAHRIVGPRSSCLFLRVLVLNII